ncbi:MAG: sulfatase-like hydrolase/transferase [Flavobacteriaceae bacterium]
MYKRIIIPLFGSICALLVLSLGSCKNRNQGIAADIASKKPNIILIMADDLGYETIGVNGSEEYTTPHLDQMAQNGMQFTQCHATPLCTPSRVQLMTGKYNFRNYIGFGLLDSNEKTFAHYLKEDGYKTFVAGKWQLLGNAKQRELAQGKVGSTPEQAGFDDYCLWQLDERGNRYANPHLSFKNGKAMDFKEQFGPDIFVDQIASFMERHRNDPFLVYYPMALTHDPFVPTPLNPDFGDFDTSKYQSDPRYFGEMVSYMDQLVGKILDTVESLGLSENTLILFLGDNGTHPSVVSRWKGQRIQGNKGHTTKAGTHVPLIAQWKGTITAGQINDNLIDLSDFLPTMVETVSGKKLGTSQTDGHSFHSQLLGLASTPREWIFCHYDPNWGKFKPSRFVQNHSWKLYGDGRFYHIGNDPRETHPLSIAVQPDSVAQLITTFNTVLAQYKK